MPSYPHMRPEKDSSKLFKSAGLESASLRLSGAIGIHDSSTVNITVDLGFVVPPLKF